MLRGRRSDDHSDERGRRRKLYQDTLGRLVKVEELNWDTSVYAATTYSYNARDQLTQSNQSGQLRTFEYDGHARLWRKTTPEQGATTYSYNADDTVQSVTDARGATTTLTYNNRHLPTQITYGVPAGVAATSNVSFAYDAAGNRTSMTDGLGSVSYNYDTLSRLTAETRNFTGVGSFTLSYSYNLAGQLTSVTNPWSAQVSYAHDAVGRTTTVNGANYAGVSTYASNLRYRAFGGLKAATYGNGKTLALGYDTRLRLTQYNVAGVMGWNYFYDKFSENSGRVTYAQNTLDPTLDRSYDYDHLGRLQYAHTGNEARGHVGVAAWPPGMTPDGPYSHHTFYDQFGNLTQRAGWGGANPSYTVAFTNNRRNGAVYDASGNITVDGGQSYSYDATGQQTAASFNGLQMAYDGDRLRVKKTEDGTTTYYLRSSVLGGQVVAEINSGGGWLRGYVYLGSQLLALQQGGVLWTHQDPITKSQRLTDQAGTTTTAIDLDPWGGETTRSVNSSAQPQRYTSYIRDANQSDEAMHRRYNRWWSRFDQPDPYDGSANLAEPQSLNRYSYVQNDPVNFVDPSGLTASGVCSAASSSCGGSGDWDGWGGWSSFISGGDGMPTDIAEALARYEQGLQTTRDGLAAQRALADGNYELLAAILDGNSNVGLSVDGREHWGALGGLLARAMGGEFGNSFQAREARNNSGAQPAAIVPIVVGIARFLLGLLGRRAAPAAAAAATSSQLVIQFGRNANQVHHAFRHTDALGLNRAVVQSAIENHLRGVASQITSGQPFNQVITVAGQRIQYTAFRLPDSTINVGRIHGVP